MSLDQIRQKVEALTKRHDSVSKRQSETRGELNAKKQELVALKKEIEAAGFDPKTLKEDRARLEAELLQMVEVFEKEITAVEEAYDAFQSKK